MLVTIPTAKLASGYEMPTLGLGTWNLRGEECIAAVRTGLELGYTHIDTADAYENHAEIGHALANVDRSRLFLTS